MNELARSRKPVNTHFYLAVIIGSLLLMLPAFYNGYPLLTGDSAVYLKFGFKALTPFEKSITYGMFVWLGSLNGLSLWPVIFFQAYLTSYLIISVYKQFTFSGFLLRGSSLLLLLLLSGLPWVVCQLQPDIFIAVALLAATLLIMGSNTKANTLLLYFIFFGAIATHVAQVPLFVFTLCLLFLFRKTFSNTHTSINITTRISMLVLLSIAGTAAMGPVLLRSKQVYILSSLLHHGTLKQYLDDNCGQHDYKLCKYKDSLPQNAHYFLWDDNSPLNKEGGLGGLNAELNDIIHSSLTSRRYLLPYLKATVCASGKQLCSYTVANLPAGNSNADVTAAIAQYLPHELPSFYRSKQNTDNFDKAITVCKYVGVIIILFSLAILLLQLFRKQLTHEVKFLLLFSIILIIFNACECGVFSAVTGRYGSRVLWLVSLCAIISLQPKRKSVN